MLMGMGQYSTDTGVTINTSGVQIASPSFVGPCPSGTVMNPQTGACVTGSTPTSYSTPSDMGCDSGYALSTDPDGNPICYAVVAACPVGATCSIIPGVPNTNLYLGIGAVVSLFILASVFGGHK
jgi:hypothetical protein